MLLPSFTVVRLQASDVTSDTAAQHRVRARARAPWWATPGQSNLAIWAPPHDAIGIGDSGLVTPLVLVTHSARTRFLPRIAIVGRNAKDLDLMADMHGLQYTGKRIIALRKKKGKE